MQCNKKEYPFESKFRAPYILANF